MEAKLFKAVTVFRNVGPGTLKLKHFDSLEKYEIDDPGKTQWRALGFLQTDSGHFIEGTEAGKIIIAQMRERNLPAATVKEAMIKKLDKIQADTGRRPNKKDYAQIKDEVIVDLLPRAFIRTKTVPILIRGPYVHVFTSSSKLCDDVITLLFGAVGNDKVFQPVRLDSTVEKAGEPLLTTIALHGDDTDGEVWFEAGKAATLKGPEKKAVRVKDLDVGDQHVQKLLKDDYKAIQLAIELFDTRMGSDPVASFTINESLIISKLVLAGIAGADAQADKADRADALASHVWLVGQTLDTIVTRLEEHLGLKKQEEEDDDEL